MQEMTQIKGMADFTSQKPGLYAQLQGNISHLSFLTKLS